ncbi:fibronectin type III domain-containing protein, partial [candidate division CSSED10-310 bacterium]
LQFLARRYHRIAQVVGMGYMDPDLSAGKDYWYEVRSVTAGDVEQKLASDITVVAGEVTRLPAASHVSAQAGDSAVLVTWEAVEWAVGFDVYRQTSTTSSPLKVNKTLVMSTVTHDLKEKAFASPRHGFTDARAWTDVGTPTTRLVDGKKVDGPVNGTTYSYQVVARNILAQPGSASSWTSSVTPRDQTPPGLPTDLKAETVGQALKITWSKVTTDIKGHIEDKPLRGYHVYRSDKQADMKPQQINSSMIPHPSNTAVDTVEFIDSDPAIIPKYGEKDYFYRLRCVDSESNQSSLSAAAPGHVDDTSPPACPQGTTAAGDDDSIRVYWDLNNEPDMDAYVIYRSQCHFGEWVEPGTQEASMGGCGPFVLLGEVSQKDAQKGANAADNPLKKPYYDDEGVPPESYLCYAYLVKARDISQNQSGDWPYPDRTRETVVCEKLRDKSPPLPPVVTAVQARDRAILIEWMAAPCQDLGAFHVHRATSEKGSYDWIGGIRIQKPPLKTIELKKKFQPSSPAQCDDIPLVAHKDMKAGSFIDEKVEPKKIYYYKVTAVDQTGNESPLIKSPPYSTFTFSAAEPLLPTITPPISKSARKCGLVVKWTPPFDAKKFLGFVVFRSMTETGNYRQISPLIQGNSYEDTAINTHQMYWYQVQVIDSEGRPSSASRPLEGFYE